VKTKGRCAAFSAGNYDGGLTLGDMSKAFIVKDDFFFGYSLFSLIGLVHQKLDEDLKIPLVLCKVSKSQWIN